MHIAHMLPVPGSKVKHIREIITYLSVLGVFRAYVLILKIQELVVLEVFRACLLRNTPSTRSISRFSTADTSGRAVFGGTICAYSLYFQAIQGSVCIAGTARTGRISSVGTASTRSTLNICSMYTRSKKYNSTICAPIR